MCEFVFSRNDSPDFKVELEYEIQRSGKDYGKENT